jgi:hypothetical protein
MQVCLTWRPLGRIERLTNRLIATIADALIDSYMFIISSLNACLVDSQDATSPGFLDIASAPQHEAKEKFVSRC